MSWFDTHSEADLRLISEAVAEMGHIIFTQLGLPASKILTPTQRQATKELLMLCPPNYSNVMEGDDEANWN